MNPDILSFKPGHDGQVAYIRDKHLQFSIEAEKDGRNRYSPLEPSHFIGSIKYLEKIPAVIALSGWFKNYLTHTAPNEEAGYFGYTEESIVTRKQKLFGTEVEIFSSSHERSHLFCSYGLSPFPQGQACYALIWEGYLGAFYKIDEQLNVEKMGNVLRSPGVKYQFLYELADPSYDALRGFRDSAGKLMALVSYGQPGTPDREEKAVLDYIMKANSMFDLNKNDLRHSPFFNMGVEKDEFKRMARLLSDAIFDRFFCFAEKNLKEGLPLLVSGGCGLNCDWNSDWKNSGLFSDVFVPPCTNDTGAAIGTAIDALRHYTGSAKITWDVYAGEDFVMDYADMTGIETAQLDFKDVSQFLSKGKIIAWIQGRYEIGPRALGNRSLLAMPFSKEMHSRLNATKQRESFRPIAPVCLEEDMDLFFSHQGPSPHMLYFQRVLTADLPAITHVDGSARLQSVNSNENPRLYALLRAFKAISGYGVLCNTSLNFKGEGFINRMSDLVKYCRERSLDGFVVNDKFYTFN